jgi:hypothetical protein
VNGDSASAASPDTVGPAALASIVQRCVSVQVPGPEVRAGYGGNGEMNAQSALDKQVALAQRTADPGIPPLVVVIAASTALEWLNEAVNQLDFEKIALRWDSM